MLFELISSTNKPKVQSRSHGGKLRFKGTGAIYVEEEKAGRRRGRERFSKMSASQTRDHEPFISNTVYDHKRQ